MALMLGAFMLHGITPGPTMMAQHPEMFWGIVTSMFIGNCILILTMLPLIGSLAKITLDPDQRGRSASSCWPASPAPMASTTTPWISSP